LADCRQGNRKVYEQDEQKPFHKGGNPSHIKR